MENEKKFGTKQIAITAVLLAICIISQVFKNLSVFITGPIINACIALAVLMVNLPCGIILSIITPITAYFIASSPIMSAVPAMILFIMLGNVVLAVMTHVLIKKPLKSAGGNLFTVPNIIKAVIASLAKGVFMGLTISLWLLPTFIPVDSPLRGRLPIFQRTFSLYQFLTACIGFVYVFIIYAALRKSETNFQKSDS